MSAAATQSTTFTNYLMFVQNAAPLAHDFIVSMLPRIQRAYDMGETVEMIAEEIRFRWSVRKLYTVVCEMNADARDFEGNRRLVIAAPLMMKALNEIASHDLMGLTGAGRVVAEAMQRAARSAIAEARR